MLTLAPCCCLACSAALCHLLFSFARLCSLFCCSQFVWLHLPLATCFELLPCCWVARLGLVIVLLFFFWWWMNHHMLPRLCDLFFFALSCLFHPPPPFCFPPQLLWSTTVRCSVSYHAPCLTDSAPPQRQQPVKRRREREREREREVREGGRTT